MTGPGEPPAPDEPAGFVEAAPPLLEQPRAETGLAEVRYTVMLVPENGGGPVRQWGLRLGQLRLGLTAAAMLAVLAALGLVLSVTSVWRAQHESAVVAENLALRGRLAEIEATLEEVDAELRRLRMYGTVLEDTQGFPGQGPVDGLLIEEDWWGEGAVGPEDWDELAQLGDPLDEHEWQGEGPVAWADDVQRRIDLALDAMELAEGEVGPVVENAEYWRHLSAALPRGLPVDAVLTSGFGWRRSPINRRWKFHSGLDLSAPVGTVIRAPGPGLVVMARWNSGYGRMIELDHGYGVVSRYAHNARLFVSEGAEVERGDPIATIGMTGQTTGPHLHYEIHVEGQAVDPMEYME